MMDHKNQGIKQLCVLQSQTLELCSAPCTGSSSSSICPWRGQMVHGTKLLLIYRFPLKMIPLEIFYHKIVNISKEKILGLKQTYRAGDLQVHRRTVK